MSTYVPNRAALKQSILVTIVRGNQFLRYADFCKKLAPYSAAHIKSVLDEMVDEWLLQKLYPPGDPEPLYAPTLRGFDEGSKPC